MRQRKHIADRKRNRYIERKERQTRMYQVREVCNQALPNHSHKTDETSGVDLTQKREGWIASGQEWVWMSGINLMRERGKIKRSSGWGCIDKTQGWYEQAQQAQQINQASLEYLSEAQQQKFWVYFSTSCYILVYRYDIMPKWHCDWCHSLSEVKLLNRSPLTSQICQIQTWGLTQFLTDNYDIIRWKKMEKKNMFQKKVGGKKSLGRKKSLGEKQTLCK